MGILSVSKRVFISIIIILILLTLEGISGNWVNLFVIFPTNITNTSPGNLFAIAYNTNSLIAFHIILGIFLVFAGGFVLVYGLKIKDRYLTIVLIIGLVMILSAIMGALLFVFSGFTDGMSSGQMGDSMIGAYAFYFLALYCIQRVSYKEKCKQS